MPRSTRRRATARTTNSSTIPGAASSTTTTTDPDAVQPDPRARFLQSVFHHRWAAPILAELNRLTGTVGGGRVVMLVESLGASRESIVATLETLTTAVGWVAWNPGYGHPMRPELTLTKTGRPIAIWCGLYVALVEKIVASDDERQLAFRKWSAPLLSAIAHVRATGEHHGSGRAGARFNELRLALPDVTPRALTIALRRLEEAGFIDRRLLDEYPPAAVYSLDQRGEALVRIIERAPGL